MLLNHALEQAHSVELHRRIEKLPWGAQWEIARIVTAGKDYGSFTNAMIDELQNLKNNARAAPAVAKIFSRKDRNSQQIDNAFAKAYAQESASTVR